MANKQAGRQMKRGGEPTMRQAQRLKVFIHKSTNKLWNMNFNFIFTDASL